MNTVFIVPTGIGCEIGGHAGDATPAAKLVASVCDKLFIHPNVVNASDINEMTENMLYVEGSMLDRFLEGEIRLKEVYNNKILVAVNEVTPDIVNAVSGARVTIGADIEIVKFKISLEMVTSMFKGKASGEILRLNEAIEQISKHNFDVLVVNTPIETDEKEAIKYLVGEGGTNPWGGVEAELSKSMSERLNKPVVHAPIMEDSGMLKTLKEIVDPRKAAEMVSICFLHCCLKGAHKAPRISYDGYQNSDIDFLISPINAFGRPHKACVNAGIPIIAVEENKTVLNDEMPDSVIVAKNYLEAVGIISAKKAGVSLSSIKRPLNKTEVYVA